jgi:hypothetical protein
MHIEPAKQTLYSHTAKILHLVMGLLGTFEMYSHRYREGLISGFSVGFFLIVVGALFVTTPTLYDSLVYFFNHFELARVSNLGIYFPAPIRPFTQTANLVVYRAVEQFSFIWGIFQIVILALRFVARSPARRFAETASNIVFWLGTGFLIRTFLLESITFPSLFGLTRWFTFWAALVMLIGVSLIIRGIVLAAVPRRYLA